MGSAQRNHEEKKAATFVEAAEAKLEVILNKYTKFEWAFATNITDENEKASLAYQVTGPVIRSFPNAFCGYEHELIGTQFFCLSAENRRPSES